MAIDNNSLFVPGRGTVFLALPAATLPAAPLTGFTLRGTPPTGWDTLGHTSKENLPAFKKDGGDASSLDTWLTDSQRTVYASTSWSLSIAGLQIDVQTLQAGFNGEQDNDGGYRIAASNNGIQRQVYLHMQDGTTTMGFYMPNCTLTLGDAPSLDAAKFVEVPLAVAINAADPAKLAALADGRAAIIKLFRTGLTKV